MSCKFTSIDNICAISNELCTGDLCMKDLCDDYEEELRDYQNPDKERDIKED